MGWKKTKIGKFLFEREGRFKPDDKSLLNLDRLEKIDFSGNFHIGQKASRTDMILIKRGDFVISGINVSKGAMGIYRKDHDITATIHYSSYTFDESKIDINYFEHFLQSAEFLRLLEDKVKGGIKTEIKAKHLLNLEISLPSLDRQKRIAEKLKLNEEKQKNLQLQITNQKTNLKNLRKQILQDAIEGKLTKEWREKNPDIEPASELLKKIKKEKDRLISEKKIKKEKPLPEINKSEIPFELPESWIWTRMGGIIRTYSGDFLASYQMSKNGEIPVYGGNGVNGFHDKYNVSDQKIVIGRVGAYCGSIHLTPEKAWVTDNSLIVSFSEADLNKKWLVFLLKVVDLGKLSFNGSQPVISGTKIYSQTAPLPPFPEQLAIVSKLQNLMQKLDEAEKQIKKSLETSKLLTKTILAEAFSFS